MAATSELIELRNARLGVDLAPAIGGSVSAFRLDGRDVLRPLSPADRETGNVLGVASFPMIPFANRIAGNAFEFEGRTYRTEANNSPEIYHVHGTAWRLPWTVATTSGATATLTLEVRDPELYSYSAEQRFALTDTSLAVTMSVTNRGSRPMPFGFGQHPWFLRDEQCRVQFDARSYHLLEPELVLGERISLPPDLSFAAGRSLPAHWRCGDYGGWDGRATLTFPGQGVGLHLRGDATFKHLMLYADPKLPVFCLEPQTNGSGALNRAGWQDDPAEGVIVLAPDETASGTLTFEAFRL